MIVKMKKVSIVVFDRFRDQSLKALRQLGLVHIDSRPVSSDELTRFSEQKIQLERAHLLLPEQKKKKKKQKKKRGRKEPASQGNLSAGSVTEEDIDGCLESSEEVVDLTEKIRLVKEKIDRLTREQQRLALWGDYDPQEIRELAEKGVYISLYELSTNQFKELPEELDWVLISQTKSFVRLAVVTVGLEAELEFEPVTLAERGRVELQQLVDSAGKELQGLEHRL